MRNKHRILNILASLFLALTLFLFVAPDIADARRGSRRSFGGSRRSYSKPKSTQKKSTQPKSSQRRSMVSPTNKKVTSFGGNRLSSSKAYTQKYGTPRKKSTVQGKNAQGMPQRYVVNNYGGYGSSLMTGYLLGSTSWMWAMPFHPAFYYSRPYYHQNADGTVSVYPPTFSATKLIFTLVIAAVIIYIIYTIIKSRRRKSRELSQSSFG